MATDSIHAPGRGPEIEGTRLTVYDLLDHFLDPVITEASICQRYDLTPEQVADARARVLNEPDVYLANYMLIQFERSPENPPGVVEQVAKTHATLLRFRHWLAQRSEAEARDPANRGDRGSFDSRGIPSFKEWISEREPATDAGI